mmetsp:Transcript_2553/g.2186  ORF Transcript_2553/g.2186 Transcript_2553/m.2186 type:complete len:95 (+) Transcript_2553:759-1043(+)
MFGSGSSSQGLFSLFNQFQLLMLIPMLPISYPGKFKQFILGMDFTMLSLDFIPVEDIPLVDQISKWIDLSQSDAYLNEIGLSSNSVIINYLPMM